jgi:hypothetical protein
MGAVQHGAGQVIDVTGVTADHERRDDPVERCLGRRNRGVSKCLAPADQAVLGLDLHQQNIEMIPGLAGEQRMRAAHIEGKRDHEAFDGGDQHGGSAATLGEAISASGTQRALRGAG